LTVAIPTYNRHDSLRRCLRNLLPQLRDTTSLLIMDNASNPPVSSVVDEEVYASGWRGPSRVIANTFNVGLEGNLLRCFEACETDWLWVLGDDDFVSEGAIAAIEAAIRAHPNATFLHFATSFAPRTQAFLVNTLDELLEKTTHLGDLLFISAGVYRWRLVIDQLAVGYGYCGSAAPHLAMLFATLRAGGSCFLSSDCIIRSRVPGVPHAYSFVKVAVKIGLLGLLDLPLRTRARLLALLQTSFPDFRLLTCYLLAARRSGADRGEVLWIYRTVRAMRGGRPNLQWVASMIYGIVLRCGLLGWYALDILCRARYGCALQNKLTDPMEISDFD